MASTVGFEHHLDHQFDGLVKVAIWMLNRRSLVVKLFVFCFFSILDP